MEFSFYVYLILIIWIIFIVVHAAWIISIENAIEKERERNAFIKFSQSLNKYSMAMSSLKFSIGGMVNSFNCLSNEMEKVRKNLISLKE